MKITCPYLSEFPSLKHAFFEADPESNRNKAMEEMTSQDIPLLLLKQVHGNKVIKVTEPWEKEQEADGMVTTLKGVALGILTGDCGPVLFFDPEAEVIGACHAGWRGAKAGILQETLKVMEELGAKRARIYATLGPTIQQQYYEVGPEFPDLIGEKYETYFTPSKKQGHHYFNLPRYICDQLLKEKLKQIHDVQRNTFTGNFASLRRLLSEGKKELTFCNLSAIAIM